MEYSCRVCLQTDQLMVDIFENVEDLQKNLNELLEECGGLKISKDDAFPKYLCKDCTSELLYVAKFREKCAHSQKLLDQIDLDELLEQHLETQEDDENVFCDVIDVECSNQSQFDTSIEPELIQANQSNESNKIEYEIPKNLIVYPKETTPLKILPVKSPPTDLLAAAQFVCDVCGAAFVHAINLERHQEKAHKSLQFWTCVNCGHYFSQQEAYENHLNLHACKSKEKTKKPVVQKPSKSIFTCTYCSKANSSLFALQMHQRTHTNERPFVCEQCSKAFKTQSSLSTHLKRHSGLPDYVCTVCQKTFYEISNLHLPNLWKTI